MPKMLEMIRESAVPATLLRSAARGALSLPVPEMLEILVFLSTHAVFGEQARLTLAMWDEASARTVLSDPASPKPVLDYFSSPQNLRGTLVPALLENSKIADARIALLAETLSRELVPVVLQTSRVRDSAILLGAIKRNPKLSTEDHATLDAAITAFCNLRDWTQYEFENAAEIAAQAHTRFELVRGDADERDELAELLPLVEAVPESAATRAAMVAAHAAQLSAKRSEEKERISVLQKIARMSVGDRVQLAMKGTKDERFVLVRDGSKVVCLAVLESPKVSEQVVEMFAAMKNVQESVLRGIASKRKFMKSYAVVRTLANNPRVPLDVSLSLLKNLLPGDLKNLSMNKNVSDTVKKVATKMYKEKASSRQA